MILEIKSVTAAQVPEIVALDRLCIGGLWKADAYLREINSPRSSLLSLGIKSSYDREFKTIGMGCLWAIVDEAHITLLAIAPEYRRQGLGQLLLTTLLQDAIARQLEWPTLEVNVNNSGAIALYQKYGFEVVGTRKGYYQPAGDDAAILWLKEVQSREFKSRLARWQQKLSDRLHPKYTITAPQPEADFSGTNHYYYS